MQPCDQVLHHSKICTSSQMISVSCTQAYIRELQHPLVDVNACNTEQEAPIHALVKRKCKNRREREEKMELLLALLTYSWGLDIDTPGMARKTALHLAVEVKQSDANTYPLR